MDLKFPEIGIYVHELDDGSKFTQFLRDDGVLIVTAFGIDKPLNRLLLDKLFEDHGWNVTKVISEYRVLMQRAAIL